jgi:CBS domain-containing protein
MATKPSREGEIHAPRAPGSEDVAAMDGEVVRAEDGRVEIPAERITVPPGATVSRTEVSMDAPSTAGDVMTESVKTAVANTDLATVATLMRDENVGIVPIVDDDGRLIGVITDRDIVVRVDAESAPVDLVRAGDVMTTNLVTVHRDDDLDDVIDRMGQEGLQRILVADEANRLVGIISIGDLARRTDLPERIQDTLDQISRRHL